MDLMAAIGLLSSIVTLEEAGRSWVLIVKYYKNVLLMHK